MKQFTGGSITATKGACVKTFEVELINEEKNQLFAGCYEWTDRNEQEENRV